jgi:hypothetical protein
MPAFYQFPMPVPPDDLAMIQNMVREAGIVMAFDSRLDAADATLYRHQSAEWTTKCRALVDLNIFKDILSVARLGDKRDTEARRLGAALLAFCQCAGIEIEPSMALHESPENWKEEFLLFRRIDNAETTDLVKVALGEIEQIPAQQLPLVPCKELPSLMPNRLRGHTPLQTALLKLALIGRTGGGISRKFQEFMDWSFHHFLFSREAVHLALFHLTGNSPNPILKKTNAQSAHDRMRALDNAVWDLLLVRNWLEKVRDQSTLNQLWVLCTRDRGIQRLAREMMLANAGEDEIARYLGELFERACGSPEGAKLHQIYQDFMSKLDDPNRPCNQSGFDTYCEDLNTKLRSEYLE